MLIFPSEKVQRPRRLSRQMSNGEGKVPSKFHSSLRVQFLDDTLFYILRLLLLQLLQGNGMRWRRRSDRDELNDGERHSRESISYSIVIVDLSLLAWRR
jgi:hypothetical protein